MADFEQAFTHTIMAEGGFTLSNVSSDRGGQTYAGISRRAWPNWPGWVAVDTGATPSTDDVRAFYKARFWNPLRLDEVQHQRTAEHLFDFAVNAGAGMAVKLAQVVLGTQPDGVIGDKTLAALNGADPLAFENIYTIAKIARYRDICMRDRSQVKFLLGWISRALKPLKGVI